MARSVTLAPGELYHLYNRGVDKRKIFLSEGDYKRFLALLYVCNSTSPVRFDDIPQGSTSRNVFKLERGDTLIELCAYCLMPNHIHLLVREKQEGGISRFMQKLATGYTMYFNIRRQRTGALFQGRFKVRNVNEDLYLKYLFSYIHLNPVKLIEPKWKEDGIKNRGRAKKFLDAYPYSSFSDYCGKTRQERLLVALDVLSAYYDYSTPKDFEKSVIEFIRKVEPYGRRYEQ